MGVTGEDVKLSEKALSIFPYLVECKNQEKLSIWSALEQSETRKDATPLLVFKRNRSEVYCALKFDDFMDIIKKLNMQENLRYYEEQGTEIGNLED